MCVRERGRVRKSVFPRFLVTYLKTTDNIECKSQKIINENSEKSTWFSVCVCVCAYSRSCFFCAKERGRERGFSFVDTPRVRVQVCLCVYAPLSFMTKCV